MSTAFSKVKEVFLAYINPVFIRPKAARIIITANCLLRCQMCTFWHHQHVDPALDLIKYWIKELADFGIKHIGLGGGEPLMRKDIVDIVKEIKSYGMTASLTTNGWLVGQIPFPPVDFCEISIDGATAETHDKIRGVKGSWEKAVNAVRIAKQHCRVSQLNFVLQKDNYHEVADFCQMAKGLGVPVTLIPCSPQLAAQPFISDNLIKFDRQILKDSIDTAIKMGNILNQEFLKFFLDKSEKINQRQRCMAPFRVILIFINGDIYPCGNFDRPVGNLSREKKLKDIYQDYAPIREAIWKGLNEPCNKCAYPDVFNRKVIQKNVAFFMRKTLKKCVQKLFSIQK